ncbi:MAG: YfhO family protein [Clostridiales bacterium]|nr:YfhO family protein [Clostridiales bacterium]
MKVKDVFPFGTKSVLVWDMEFQYKDFYSYLWEVLHGNANLQYSFSKSLGGPMVGLVAYYISSIFNIGLLFVEKNQVAGYIAWLTVFKISLSGLTCSYFLKKCFDFEKKEFFVLCASTSYALMEYNVCYCRNLMWLDGVIFLPLVCLGVHHIIKGQNGTLLYVSVVLTIICNWYTGYMVCLMSGFFFLFDLLVLELISLKEIKRGCIIIVRYVWYMLLGVMTSAVVLLPALMSLMGGRASFRFQTHWQNMTVLQALHGFALDADYSKATAAILYCGGLLLILVIYGLINWHISIRKKIGYIGLLALLVASFVYKDVELLWTAFVMSTSFNYRFAFVDGFILVIIAADIFETLEKKRERFIIWPMVVAILFIFVLLKDVRYICLVGLYGVFLILYFKFAKVKTVSFCALGLLLSLELFYNAELMFGDYHADENSYEEYVDNMSALLSEIKTKDTDLYRFEKNYSYLYISSIWDSAIATGEALAFNYMGLEHYSSAYDTTVDQFLGNMGYSDYPLHYVMPLETYWNSSILPIDSLLGLRYILSDVQPYGYEKVSVEHKLPEGYQLYKNQSALPLAFCISENDISGRYREDPFDNHNSVYSVLMGKEVQLYKEVDQESVDTGDKMTESYDLHMNQDGPLYLFVDGYRVHSDLYTKNCELFVNGKKMQDTCQRFLINVVYAGYYQQGEVVNVTIQHKTEQKSHYLSARQLDTDAFDECIEWLRSNNYVSKLDMSGGKVSATYSSPESSRVLFTIPYDTGWTIKIDGKKADYHRFANALIMLNVDSGEHLIEMEYTVHGSRAGLILSLTGILGFAGCCLWRRKRKGQK